MEILYSNLLQLTWQQAVMWVIGGVLIYLAIKKDMEPTLLLPIGFGAILVNLPNSGAVETVKTLFEAGISNELFPLILFIGIGAMIDFGPLLSNPKLMISARRHSLEFSLLFVWHLCFLTLTMQRPSPLSARQTAPRPLWLPMRCTQNT